MNSQGVHGLAWVSLELFEKNYNGFSADIKETGFKSAMSSIPENKFPDVLVYPNPSDGLINIEIPESAGNLTVCIFDLYGNEIRTSTLDKKVSMPGLKQGAYFLRLSDRQQRSLIKKVIVL
jgi:hypothetical protein